jgi:hypothetical protein
MTIGSLEAILSRPAKHQAAARRNAAACGEIFAMLDLLFLSRLQWAGVIGWYILLPAFTVGIASTRT